MARTTFLLIKPGVVASTSSRGICLLPTQLDGCKLGVTLGLKCFAVTLAYKGPAKETHETHHEWLFHVHANETAACLRSAGLVNANSRKQDD